MNELSLTVDLISAYAFLFVIVVLYRGIREEGNQVSLAPAPRPTAQNKRNRIRLKSRTAK